MELTRFAVYPDSDGEPIAENDLQFDWIALLKWHAQALFHSRDDVNVAGDHLIYPVEGDPLTRLAPDVYVAYGRPKGKRGSYQVWRENKVFPQEVFEVWSPANRPEEMDRKRELRALRGRGVLCSVPGVPVVRAGLARGSGGVRPGGGHGRLRESAPGHSLRSR